jgi:cobalt-zinc-cadmium efflux system protein
MTAHDHSGPNVHDRAHGVAAFDRAFAIGIALNVAFVAVEAVVGWRVDSLALLADAGHNLSDVAGLLLAWAGTAAGRLAPDRRHTYGWRRASILAALANAILLLVAMGSLAWEAIGRFGSPHLNEGGVIIVVAAVGVVVNGATAALFMRGGSDLNIRGAFLHMAGDALVSLGVVAAGALYLWTGWGWLDPAASLAIAVVIVIGSWSLFRQSVHLMFDGVPDSVDLDAVRDFLSTQVGVKDVHHLHVWAMSTSEIALTAHLVIPGGHPGDAFLDALAHSLRERFGIAHPTVQIELGDGAGNCATPST